jgi:ABC-2 type transport system permease protein
MADARLRVAEGVGRAEHVPLGRMVTLGWAFVERQTNLWKRHWAWEVVWLVYGVVNTLAVTFIAQQLADEGVVRGEEANALVLFLLIGTLVWAYLSAILDDISLVITWERWEGTIEHTLMAPVPRVAHLVGTAVFGVLHAIVRTTLVMAIALPFFAVDLSQADWGSAIVVLLVGSLSLIGLGILAGVLPLVYPERGEQLSFMVQACVLLVSGVYCSVEVLPGWLQTLSWLSPATYLLEGVRAAIIDGAGVTDVAGDLAALLVFAVVLIPVSILVFGAAERWAKRTGRLKRQG